MPKGNDTEGGRKLSGRELMNFHPSNSGMVSYEDLLIAQYLEEMKKSRIEVKKDRDVPSSPYMQRLPSSTNHSKYSKRRPQSATARMMAKNDKPKIDAKFIADPNLWDPETPRSEKPHSFHRRPASAPIKRVGRPQSGASSRFSLRLRPGSAKRPRSLYRKQPHTIRVVAFKNGSREAFVKATAPNIKMLLECLTVRLSLPFAARRIFLEDGIEVFDAQDIPPDADIYASMGENYKNPHLPTKRNLILKEGAVWTLSGINLPEEGKKKKTRSRLSKRMMTLIDRKKVRILVYRNGKSTEPIEVVADLANTEEFLVACTAKMDLRSHARVLYDWEGNELSDLTGTPILDDSLQPGRTPVMGPLWVSIGEGFSPSGTAHYIYSITEVVKAKLKNVKFYKKQINFAMSDDEQDKVTIPKLLSFKPEELYDALEKAEADVDRYTEILKSLKEKHEALRSEQEREEGMGASYKMTHIQELKADDRLVGTKGLKLKVYENGTVDNYQYFFFNMREALKGIGHDKHMLMARLLDELSTSHWTSSGVNPKLNAVAQKLYDKYGHEITDVYSLESEQEIWVSYGETFICPFTYCIEAFFDKANKVEIEGQEHIVREQIMQEDVQANDEYSHWDATIGFPALFESSSNQLMADPDKLKWMTESAEVDQRGCYLLHKKRQDLALYPEIVVNEKFRLRGDDKRPPENVLRRMKEVQTWVITQSGYIICKHMPQLCLSVSDTVAKGRFFDQDCEMEGLIVTLQKKMAHNPNQTWKFTSEATIASDAYPDRVLTYLGNRFGDEEAYMENTPEGLKSGARVYLILSEPRSRREGACQRFALKQEKFDNLGQWKYTQTSNSEWHKLAYSWPITVNGDLNEKYDWPMEGYLIPHAPPLHKSDKKSGLTGMTPIRLYALKNGERDASFAFPVVGPNLTSMMKEPAKKDKKDKHKKHAAVDVHSDSVDVDVQLHCRDLTVRELEFIMFLDHCTSLLDMPFAARRLFDANGNEHFTLQSLKRDQLVYVSCGEQWSDPNLTRAEQQRRFLLSQLSTDVGKIRQFVSLRDPQSMVMEADGGLTANTNVVINKCWSREEEDKVAQSGGDNLQSSQDFLQAEDSIDYENMTARERALIKSEKRLDSLRWPWERLVNVGNSSEEDDPEATKYSNKDLYDKYRPKPSPRVPRDTLQRFVYEDGFIASSANRGLVMGVNEQEGRVIDVVLQKRRPDDINQRWVMKENGEIRSKFNQQLVLTVATPIIQSDDTRPLSYARCQVTLQSRRGNQYGKAHQRWRYDAESGFIHSFSAELHDKEITAANKADVCTFAVSHNAQIDQPGYLVELPDRKNRDIRVCLSCARAMRGRFKLQRLPNNKPFACAMGQAKKLKLRQVGSFCVLNGKVDLSTHEAELTLQNWEESLVTLREETSIKTIAKQISAAKSVKTVKLLVYKNGEGRMRSGVKVYGSSIQGILNQCTHKLELNNAATRLYTEDGVMILDMDDLIDWAVENYKTDMADRIERMILMENGESVVSPVPPEGGDNSEVSQRHHANLARAMANMEQFDEDERGGGDNFGRSGGDNYGRGGDAYGGDNEEAGEGVPGDNPEEKTELDTQEASKVAKQRELMLSKVPLPSLDNILQIPIELWVSGGKNFVPPEVVESKEINRRKKRAFRAQVSLDLEIEKHVLRQMKGRRLDELNPGEYKSTLSSTQPVVIEGNWQRLTTQEQVKHDNVHKLETHLGEIKANQNLSITNVNLKGKLYQQPNMKRVMAYPNGESIERAVYIWGETMDQLLESATSKLSLWRKARCFFTEEGKLIETFEDMERDQLVCASTSRSYKKPKVTQQDVEVKANWGRARRQHGPTATDLTVSAEGNVKVDVDPFGPPELALPLEAAK